MALILTGSSGSTTLDSSAGLTFSDSSNQQYASSPYVLKNRIINGAMVIDQRNAGASVTGNDAVFPVDRFKFACSQSSKFTAQQNAGSVTPPVGFSNYLGITSSSAYAVTSGDFFTMNQPIEAFNTADLGWGTANAKTVTLSFWVRSSLTGTFGGSLANSNADYSYPYTYTISNANTWEQKTITIAGPTAGTWLGATNGIGIRVYFGIGVGSTLSGTAGAWTSTFYQSATGATSVVGTNGATWYVTGVQLEVGSTATPFERRLYNQELANCQRYYERRSGTTYQGLGIAGNWYGTTSANLSVTFPVPKRAVPSSSYSGISVRNGGGFSAVTALAGPYGTNDTSGCIGCEITLSVASGGTSGYGASLLFSSGGGYLDFSSEL